MAELSGMQNVNSGTCGAHIGAHGLVCGKQAAYRISFWDVELGRNFEVEACVYHAAEARKNDEALKIETWRPKINGVET